MKLFSSDIYRNSLLRIILSTINYVLFILLAVQIVFLFFVGPRYQIKTIDLDANVYLSDRELMDVLGINGDSYLFMVDPLQLEERLELLPQVKKAQVSRVFPASLKIFMQGSRTLVQVLIAEDSGQIPVCFDNQGVVMNRGEDHFDNVPVLSGLVFDSFIPGAKVPGSLKSLFHDLDKIRQTSPFIYDLISEIEIRPNGDSYDLMLYFTILPVSVHLGSTIELSHLKKVLIVLDALKYSHDWQNIEEVDFRTEQVVYRIREDKA